MQIVECPRFALRLHIETEHRLIPSIELASGHMGVIEGGQHHGKIVLKVFNGLVLLNDPSQTWDSHPFNVRHIKPSSAITILFK